MSADTTTDITAEKITADMVIHDVVATYPETVKVFQAHGLPCTACQVGARESVAGGARIAWRSSRWCTT
jgi:hybrid cluster-associated redox disulfide protein